MKRSWVRSWGKWSVHDRCTPNSLSQEVGLGLGAQAGEARLRDVFAQAGFTHFRRAAETPLNLILEARV